MLFSKKIIGSLNRPKTSAAEAEGWLLKSFGIGRLYSASVIVCWLHGYEGCPFVFHQPVFKKVASAGLSRLQQKRCLNSTWYFMILPQKIFFQNIKIKLNSWTWMTLKSLVVTFQALEPLQPQWPQQPQFVKNLLILMVGSFLAPKWPILIRFCGMDHQTSNFSLISDTLSVGAVEASQRYFFENWLIKHKWATLLTMQPETYYRNSQPYYPSELFTIDHFLMRHPVQLLVSTPN